MPKVCKRQHRAENLVLHDLVVLLQLRQHCRLVILGAERMFVAAPQQLGAASHGALDEAGHPLDLARMDDRSDLGSLFARVAHLESLNLGAHCSDEGVGDALMHQEAGTRQTDLARIAVHQRAGRCGCIDSRHLRAR